MRSPASGLLVVVALTGCGMVTGLSNDYKFVPDDAAAGDGGASGEGGADGAASGDADTSEGGAAACGLPGAFSTSPLCTPNCTQNCCTVAATCWNDPACKAFAECRRGCGTNAEVCLQKCERNTGGDAKDAFSAVRSCLQTNVCQNQCGYY